MAVKGDVLFITLDVPGIGAGQVQVELRPPTTLGTDLVVRVICDFGPASPDSAGVQFLNRQLPEKLGKVIYDIPLPLILLSPGRAAHTVDAGVVTVMIPFQRSIPKQPPVNR
jgi:hypothetical protein